MATLSEITSPVWGLSVTGFGVLVEGVAAIRQRIDLAIRTTKGTDPMRPEFGSLVYKYQDYPVSIAVPNMKLEITRALQMWVPEVKLIAIRHYYPAGHEENPRFEITYRTDDELLDKLLFDVRGGSQTLPEVANNLILQASFPGNPNAYRYRLQLIRNGSQIFPMPPPTGFVSIQELFEWIGANWLWVGRWHLLSDRIVCYMDAAGIQSASLAIQVMPITTFGAMFPVLQVGQIFAVDFQVNGQPPLLVMPGTFSNPGAVLAWAQNNWNQYAEWAIEFLQDDEGVFSDEFGEDMQVSSTGFRLVGTLLNSLFSASLEITSHEPNVFSALFPTLDSGESYVVDFMRNNRFVNPTVPRGCTTPEEVLLHAQTYWNTIAEWGLREDGADVLLVGFGFTIFDVELTITKA